MFLWPVCRMVTSWQLSQVSFPQAEEPEAEILPRAGSGFIYQLSSSSGLSCTPWVVCSFLVTDDFLCLYSQLICRALNLSQYSRDLCCHFLVKRDVQQWTIPQWLTKQSHCWCLPPLHTSERHPKTSALTGAQNVLVYSRKDSTGQTFAAIWKLTVIKPLEKYLLLLGTVVSAVLNYLYALKNILGCSSVA